MTSNQRALLTQRVLLAQSESPRAICAKCDVTWIVAIYHNGKQPVDAKCPKCKTTLLLPSQPISVPATTRTTHAKSNNDAQESQLFARAFDQR